MLLRFNDGFLDEKTLSNIFDIMQSSSIEKHRFLNYTILLSRYFIRLKLEQQKITSLSNSSNETIKNSPKTLSSVIDSLEKYDVLINGTNDVMRHFLALELKREDRIKADEFHGLLESYIQDKERLSTLIDDLRHYQDSLPKGRLVKTDDTNSNDSSWMPYILLILLVLIGIVLARKRT